MNQNDTSFLSQFDDAFAAAVPIGELPPDGEFAVVVKTVQFRTSRAGNPMLEWELTVDTGPHLGRSLFHRNMLGDQKNLPYLKRDLETCGLKLSKLSELKDQLEKLLDVRLLVEKVTNGDFANIRFRSRLGGGGEAPKRTTQPDAPNAPVDYADVPF